MVLQKHLAKITTWGAIASLVVIFLGWSVNVIEPDLARYASAHKLNYPYLSLIYRLADLLTLPGKGNVSYRLASLLYALSVLYTLYHFAVNHRNREVALLAMLIFCTVQATFVINQTVLPETAVMLFYTGAVFRFAIYAKTRSLWNLTEGVCGLLLAVLCRLELPVMNLVYNPFHLIIGAGWGFFPWGLFLILAVIDKIKTFRFGKKPFADHFVFYAFLFSFLALSLNPYRTDYDVIMIIPMGALITAEYINKIYNAVNQDWTQRLYKIQTILSFIFISLLFSLIWFPFPEANYYGMIHFMALLTTFTWLIFFSNIVNKLIISCVVLSIGTNLVLNTYFLPNVLHYQAGSELGKIAKASGGKEFKLYGFQTPKSNALAFYAGVPVTYDVSFKQLVSQKNCLVYTSQDLLDEFKTARPDVRVIATSPDFPISQINLNFLNPESRRKMVANKVLLKL